MEKKKILIVDDEIYSEVKLKDYHKEKIEIISYDSISEIITINGIKYREILKEKKPSRKQPQQLNTLMGLATLFSGGLDMFGGENNYERRLNPEISICEEYGLIQLKKSKLTKWERDEVVFRFEKMFERVRDGE